MNRIENGRMLAKKLIAVAQDLGATKGLDKEWIEDAQLIINDMRGNAVGYVVNKSQTVNRWFSSHPGPTRNMVEVMKVSDHEQIVAEKDGRIAMLEEALESHNKELHLRSMQVAELKEEVDFWKHDKFKELTIARAQIAQLKQQVFEIQVRAISVGVDDVQKLKGIIREIAEVAALEGKS